jgi:peptide/nickel transport system substrate-binding protein
MGGQEFIQGSGGLSRRDLLRMGAAGVGAVALGPVLAACSTSHRTSGGKTKGLTAVSGGPLTTGTPAKGGTLRVGMITQGSAETISVPASINNPDIARVFNLYDTMWFLGARGAVTPGLIEEGTPNADASVWALKVRSGVEFHDGKSLTADDIVYTIKSCWGDKNNVFYGALASIVNFAGVKKVGPMDVQVPLLHGVADFPTITVFNSCAVVQDGTSNFSDGNGTGPFRLVSFTPGSQSIFKANPNYWIDGRPYVDQLIINSSFASEDARMNALLAGSIDIIPTASPTLIRAKAGSGKVVIGNQPAPGFNCLVMRCDQGPLKDPRVRQALKLIPDRKAYVETIFSGYATVGNDLGGYTDKYFAEDIKPVQDIAQAKSLLKQAGAESLQIQLQTSTAAFGMPEMATLFAQQAKAAGIDVRVSQTDPGSFFTTAGGFAVNPFRTSFYNTGVNSLAIYYLLTQVPGGAYNETTYGSTSSNNAIYAAMAETDPTKAADKWHAVQELQARTGGYLIPQNFNWLDAYSTKVRGIQTTPAMNCDNFNFKTAWLSS